MRDDNSYTTTIKVDISAEEKASAKRISKSKGYTFQGWVGQLIKKELQKAEAAHGNN